MKHEIPNFFSKEACQAIIDMAESVGWQDATIDTLNQKNVKHDMRTNHRVMLDDFEMAKLIFDRILETYAIKAYRKDPPAGPLYEPVACNERIRIYKYLPGEFFAGHYDGIFVRNEKERSMLSILIYLNDDFTGGATAFMFDNVLPETGKACIMSQGNELHEGLPVESGVKYALRTDIMYRIRQRTTT